jgi:hypothetical protein
MKRNEISLNSSFRAVGRQQAHRGIRDAGKSKYTSEFLWDPVVEQMSLSEYVGAVRCSDSENAGGMGDWSSCGMRDRGTTLGSEAWLIAEPTPSSGCSGWRSKLLSEMSDRPFEALA